MTASFGDLPAGVVLAGRSGTLYLTRNFGLLAGVESGSPRGRAEVEAVDGPLIQVGSDEAQHLAASALRAAALADLYATASPSGEDHAAHAAALRAYAAALTGGQP